jgi:hypothetical protein
MKQFLTIMHCRKWPNGIVHAQFDGRNKLEQNEIFFMTAMVAGESRTAASQILEYKSTLDQQTAVAGYVRTRQKETLRALIAGAEQRAKVHHLQGRDPALRICFPAECGCRIRSARCPLSVQLLRIHQDFLLALICKLLQSSRVTDC